MQTETSAGGIIVYKGPKTWYVLLMKDMKGNWTFPKGRIEKDEELVVTAKREVGEEVGITDLMFLGELSPNIYWYYRGDRIKKTVHYFVFMTTKRHRPVVQTAEGISQARWVSVARAADMIGYPKSNKPLLLETERLVSAKAERGQHGR